MCQGADGQGLVHEGHRKLGTIWYLGTEYFWSGVWVLESLYRDMGTTQYLGSLHWTPFALT